MTKKVTLERRGQTRIVLVRQMPHDEQVVVGKKFRWGSGARWTVLEVE